MGDVVHGVPSTQLSGLSLAARFIPVVTGRFGYKYEPTQSTRPQPAAATPGRGANVTWWPSGPHSTVQAGLSTHKCAAAATSVNSSQ